MMNSIVFPLRGGMRGPEVNDLEDALQVLLDRKVIAANDDGQRRELAALLARDRARQIYDDATKKVIAFFQGERQLQRSGEIDEPTAGAINAVLKQLG